ncbi:unnamed protein product [Caenorhabditis bovis]|uniref:Uncharacterized protein n=1 Tax=Caenorhabditis bovis TaxID=2654633 RepID=A0A8S1EMA0_9PELO|nr:unnamed protein product [Caenorhabditis bovis]
MVENSIIHYLKDKTGEKSDRNQNQKGDVFLEWAQRAANDSKDIEDLEIDEIGSSRHRPNNIDQYCRKYQKNFKNYCVKEKLTELEKLLGQFCVSYQKNCGGGEIGGAPPAIDSFPTPEPLVPEKPVAGQPPIPDKGTKGVQSSSYCEDYRKEYTDQCTETRVNDFCDSYSKKCVVDGETMAEKKLETVDSSTENEEGSVVDQATEKNGNDGENGDDDDDLESFEEFEESESAKEKDHNQGTSNSVTSDEVVHYCNNYTENYNYFCVGDMAPENEKFCDSFKKNCPDKAPFKESGSFLGNKESGNGRGDKSLYLYKGNKKEYCDKFSVNYNYYCTGTIENVEIFTKFCPSYKNACLSGDKHKLPPPNPFDADSGTKKASSKGSTDFPDFEHPGKSATGSSHRKREKKKRACTADCDQKIFPHCTPECKCDYAYPYVQKFCNPPPLPLFLNTCRLWYHGCPKYEQYHYASQFVYSKAEKGKVLEGPKQSTTFQLLTPTGQTLPYKPTRAKRSSDMVVWPSIDDIPLDSMPVFEKITKSNNSKLKNERANFKKFDLVPAPSIPKQQKAKDDVPQENDISSAPTLPRVKKTTGGEAVPVFSDSVFSNALQQYNTFTDSRGILHRPRSRSPFTKPGLWEPNPDDPHNRDHANKFYYHPESVAVDWLQGQLAWGAHWAVPAVGTGGTDGFSAVHFPSVGTFLNIPDDYD